MTWFVKQAFLYILAAGVVACAVRVDDFGLGKPLDFPVNLVGLSPDEMFEQFRDDLLPYLQAEVLFLRRIWHADPAFFEGKFKDAIAGKYSEVSKAEKAKASTVKGMLTITGEFTTLQDPVGAAKTVAQFILEGRTWAKWLLQSKNRTLQTGQDSPLHYISDATMGNLWEAMLNVNAVQLVAPGKEKLTVFQRKADKPDDRSPPEEAVLTPIWKGETKIEESATWVAWEEDGKLNHGWVRAADVVPSLYSVTSAVGIADYPSQDAPSVGQMEEGELFAVTQNVKDESGAWWMEISDGRGYVRRNGKGYTGPVLRSKTGTEGPEGRRALKAAYEADKSSAAKSARLMFNVGMFAAGFWTGGLTWTLATAGNTLDIGGKAFLEQEAMADLDIKLEYLMMQLRSWELSWMANGKPCHVHTPCALEGQRCIRELAFYDSDIGKEGEGRCMAYDRPSREDGELCMVHADCKSGNCEPAAGCVGLACLDAACKALAEE